MGDRKLSLLVRNIPMTTTAEDLRNAFERYGEIRDVYMPKDFHTGRPRGFAFVEYASGDRRDAEDAIRAMDGRDFGGRDITVCFSREARKTPKEMLQRDTEYRSSSRGIRSRSRSRSPRRHRRRSGSRSPPLRRRRSPSRSPPRYRDADDRRSDRRPRERSPYDRRRSASRQRPFRRSPTPQRASDDE